MNKQVNPAQFAVVVAVVVALVVGVGYYYLNGNANQYKSMPAASSRAEMLQQMHADAPQRPVDSKRRER